MIFTDNPQETYKDKWNDFVFNHAQGNIFQSREMFDVYKSYKKYEPVLITIQENSELAGVLLAVIQKEYNGFLGNFTARSIIWGGPLVRDNNPGLLNQVLEEYNKEVKRKAVYSQIRNLWSWSKEENQVFLNNGFMYGDHLDIIHDLTQPLDKQLILMHKGRRKNVRRAEKFGLKFEEVLEENELEACLTLIEGTYKRVKLPLQDRSFFQESLNVLGSEKYLKTFAVRLNGEIIGTRMVLCYKDVIYDWYAGADNKHLDKYPNDYLPWKVMEWGSNKAYKYFDFGGAGKPGIPYGVRDYKLKFGGKLVNYGRFQKVHKPLLMSLGKKGIKLYGYVNGIRK